jgi:hypothetical protein
MFRVTKVNKSMCIVTHGTPEERLNIFKEILKEKKYEIIHKTVQLSLMSNLINILRNKSKDFSVSEALKDKNILMTSVVEAALSKLENERDELVGSGHGQDSEELKIVNKKIFQFKIMRMVQEKKAEKAKINSENSNQNHGNNAKMDEKEQADNKKTLEEINPKKENMRRTQCYLYIIKKL